MTDDGDWFATRLVLAGTTSGLADLGWLGLMFYPSLVALGSDVNPSPD